MKVSPLVLLAALLSWSCASQADWRVVATPTTTASLRAIKTINDRVAWASGSEGTCLRTVDGGATWLRLEVPDAGHLDFRGLVAFDENEALLASAGEASEDKARIYRTANGGQSWTLVFETRQKGAFLDGIAFWDRKTGLVLGDPVAGAWFVLKTLDGGRTWSRIDPGTLPPIIANEAAYAASNTSLVVSGGRKAWIASGGGTRARILATSDQAMSWRAFDTPMPSGASAGIFGLHFWSASEGVAVGGDHRNLTLASPALFTNNAGQTWHAAGTLKPEGLKESVARLPSGAFIAVGPTGTGISRDQGNTWTALDTLALHALSCSRDTCWAAGSRGVIAKWVVSPEHVQPDPVKRSSHIAPP